MGKEDCLVIPQTIAKGCRVEWQVFHDTENTENHGKTAFFVTQKTKTRKIIVFRIV